MYNNNNNLRAEERGGWRKIEIEMGDKRVITSNTPIYILIFS